MKSENMYGEAVKRLVILFGFMVAVVTIFLNLIRGAELMYACFMGICTMVISSLIGLAVIRFIVYVLFEYLQEQAEVDMDSDSSEDEED